MHAARPYRSNLRGEGSSRQVPGAAGRRSARGPVPSLSSSSKWYPYLRYIPLRKYGYCRLQCQLFAALPCNCCRVIMGY